jgi:hypothetical protein
MSLRELLKQMASQQALSDYHGKSSQQIDHDMARMDRNYIANIQDKPDFFHPTNIRYRGSMGEPMPPEIPISHAQSPYSVHQQAPFVEFADPEIVRTREAAMLKQNRLDDEDQRRFAEAWRTGYFPDAGEARRK